MKKIKKNIGIKKNLHKLNTSDIAICKKQIVNLITEKKYNDALEKIIKLFESGHANDTDLMIKLAEIYYANHDYQRAEKWVHNSLNKDKNNIGMLILLAKIHSENNEINKMATTLEQVLALTNNDIFSENSDGLDDLLLAVEISYDSDEIKEKYPHIAKWLEKEDDENFDLLDIANEEDNLKTSEDMSKNDNFPANEADTPHAESQNDDPLHTAQSAADSIEQMINEELQQETKPAPEKIFQQSAPQDSIFANNNTNTVSNKEAPENICANILQEDTSLTEKIKKLNAVAAKYYFDDDLSNAQTFLETAFSIDAYDAATLRNLIYLSLKQNDKAKAFDYALKMPTVEFELLDRIKNN